MANTSRLTPLGLERLKPRANEFWLSDDDGTRGGGRLAVRVGTTGAKLFYFRYSIDGVRKHLPMLPFSYLLTPGCQTLEQARAQVREYSELHRRQESRDVSAYLEAKRQARDAVSKAEQRAVADLTEIEQRAVAEADRFSLKALCDWYVKYLKAASKPSGADARSLFKCHVDPTEWASQPAKALTPKQATALLRGIVQAGKGRTAAKVRANLHAAYALAMKAELDPAAPAELVLFGVEGNPIAATGALTQFTRPGTRALSPSELGGLWLRLSEETDDAAKRAVRLALLLGGQRGQQLLRVRHAEHTSLEVGTVTILDPKGRRREPRVHLLPLQGSAKNEVALLISRSMAVKSPWLFAGVGEKQMGPDTISDVVNVLSGQLLDAGISTQPFQFKDLRRTCETMLASLGISKDLRAQIQSHGLGGIQDRHYDRWEYMDEKRRALSMWETCLKRLADAASA